MMTTPLHIILPLTIVATLFAGGCGNDEPGVDPLFCDETTGCELADTPFCDIDKLYSAELKNECIATPAPDACNRVEPCTDATKSKCDSVDVGTTGKCVECTGDTDCPGASCDTSGTCVGFSCSPGEAGDTICLAVDNTKPLCVIDDTCEQCDGTDDATQCPDPAASACDTATYTCRGCIDHDECSSEACDIDEGTCLDEGVIVHVAATGGIDGPTCGSTTDKCATIAFALTDRVDATRNTVIVAPGNYGEALDITPATVASATLTIIGKEKPTVNTSLGADQTAVRVAGTIAVTMSGIRIIPEVGGNGGSIALECESDGGTPTLTFEKGEVSGSAGLGIAANNCALTLTLSTVSGNGRGGVEVANADYSIVNNLFTGNGGINTTVSGVKIEGTNGQTEELSFNTFADNVAGTGVAHALNCSVSNLIADNNIFMLSPVVAATDVVKDCMATYSLFDSRSPMLTGPGNISADADFVSVDDYHLMPGSPGIDVADPAATIDIDIDGEGRPANGRSDVGADEVQ